MRDVAKKCMIAVYRQAAGQRLQQPSVALYSDSWFCRQEHCYGMAVLVVASVATVATVGATMMLQ